MNFDEFKCATCSEIASRIRQKDGALFCDAHAAAEFTTKLTGFDRDLWRHTLTDFGNETYRLTPPTGGEMQSVRIAFLPSHIVIYGDLCPGRERVDGNGIVSAVGYDRLWFVGATSEAYLCEKFALEKVFRPDKAAAHFREVANEHEPRTALSYREFADDAENVTSDDVHQVVAFLDQLHSFGVGDDIEACYGYDESNAALLCAIQRRFRYLWGAR